MSANAPKVTYYVVLPKQPPDVGGSVRPISRLIKEEEETVRAKLLMSTFQVLRRFAKKANAEGLRSQLQSLGVTSFVVSDQEIRSHLFLYAAAASRGGGGMALRDFADKPLFCPFLEIRGITVMQVRTEDGKRATLVDLHRPGTNITARLDAALFDFSQMLDKKDANVEDFLKELSQKCSVEVDRRFNANEEQLLESTRSFAASPSQFEPPPAMIVSPYDRHSIRAANVYSFLFGRNLV